MNIWPMLERNCSLANNKEKLFYFQMNTNNEINLNQKSLADLSGLDYYQLLDKFSIICSSDLERIMDFFAEYFDYSKRSFIQSLPTASAARTIIDVLRNHCAPISELHECLLECGLRDICDWLGKNYSINGARSQPESKKNLVNLNTIIDSSGSGQLLPSDFYTSTKNTLTVYEEILPVIHEKTNEAQTASLASPKRADTTKLFGCFKLCYIDERKLTFRKRQFSDVLSYIKEIKMIKNRHLNLYTAECILKSGTSPDHFLLYNYEPVDTTLLRDYASICQQTPNQYSTLQQLEILRDISCGLSFLHSKTETKKKPIIHSNLGPDSILIESKGNNQVSAKIFDFVHSVEMNEIDNFDSKLRDEFYKFGQVIFMVVSWRFLDRIECDRLHLEESDDEELYIYELFQRFKMDKQPNSFTIHKLLKMFYKLTAPNYDLSKGIEKSYQSIKQQIQQLNGKKSMWP